MPTIIRRLILVLVGLILIPASLSPRTTFQVTTLAPDLLMLSTDQGSYSNNSLVFTGEDGVLLVDTHHDSDVEAFKEFVDGLGLGAPKYIINTHRHVEHIGGNATLRAAIRSSSPTISFPRSCAAGPSCSASTRAESFPDIIFEDSLEIHFNGEVIRLVNIGGSHDDNEIMVHFTHHGVAHISSVVNGFNFPSVDGDGDVLQFEALTRRLMTLLPEDIRLISGHHGKAGGFDFVGHLGHAAGLCGHDAVHHRNRAARTGRRERRRRRCRRPGFSTSTRITPAAMSEPTAGSSTSWTP